MNWAWLLSTHREREQKEQIARLSQRTEDLERQVRALEARRPVVEGPVLPYRSLATKNFLNAYSLGLIKVVSVEREIDAALVQAIAEKESDLFPFAVRVEPQLCRAGWYRSFMRGKGFDPDNLWNAASYGLLQVLFSTALEYVDVKHPLDMLADPKLALEAGVLYLESLMRRYPLASTISAYNAGISTEKNRESYVKPVMERYEELKRDG